MSAIDDKYAALGGADSVLGSPTSGEHTCAWPGGSKGHYRHYENGSIFFYPTTGAHEVHGLIHDKWAKLKSEQGFLHYPETDESPSGGGADGSFNLFQGGAITYRNGADEAFETHGAIRDKFADMGFEAGVLGFPTTDESDALNKGRFNHFEGGSIYWKKSISAHEVHGLIHGFWSAHGWEGNPDLGYPISDETPTFPGSPNRFSDFENGVVFWQSGPNQPVSLAPFFGVTTSPDTIVAAVTKMVTDKIGSEKRIYIKSGPSLAKITDYSWDGTMVHNRMYKITTQTGLNIPVAPDPTSTVDLWIEVTFDRSSGQVFSSLHHANFSTKVPWPTSMGLSASTVNAVIKENLDPLVGQTTTIFSLPNPATMHLLSAKVLPDGNMNVYVQPLTA